MDDNDKSITYGVSHLDGRTPVAIAFDSSTRAMLIDLGTTIQFSPTRDMAATYDQRLAKATSDSDNITILPWVVNASTGAVLATET